MGKAMLIQPTQSFEVFIKLDSSQYQCQMLSLSENLLELKGIHHIELLTPIEFRSSYFRGVGTIKDVIFDTFYYIFLIQIESIHFQPGFLINTEM